MTAYDASQWSDFGVAQVGASAALLGLVFVGMSINLKEFVGTPVLVNRAIEAILLLGTVLITATAVLMPGQAREVLGIELIVAGALIALAVARLQRGCGTYVVRPGDRGPTRASITFRRVFGLGSAVLIVIAGVLLLAEAGGGLYWWPAAIVAAYVGAIVNAWVLLVEILR
jgi:modulator of FtsH protease